MFVTGPQSDSLHPQVGPQLQFDLSSLLTVTDRSFPVPSSIANVDPSFLEQCLSIAEDAAKPDIHSPISKLYVDSERSRLTDKYPDAFTDTYGTISGAPFVYKTGPAWPKRQGGPAARPYIRELRPTHGHRIMSSWVGIVRNIEAYLKEQGQTFTAIMGFGWANEGDKIPFCQVLVTVGVEPKTVAFEDAKTAADHIKSTILGQVGFRDIDVAVWEFTTSFSVIGPKLPSLHPLVDGAVTEFAHPFASPLGLPIAHLEKSYYEGTASLYLRRGSGSDEILALTAAHVARPPPMFPDNKGLSEKAADRHCEEVVALGDKAFEDSTTAIETRIGTLQGIIASENKRSRGCNSSRPMPWEMPTGSPGRSGSPSTSWKARRTTLSSWTASTPASPSPWPPPTSDASAMSCTPTPSAPPPTKPMRLPSTGPSSSSARTLSTGMISVETRFTSVRLPSRSSINTMLCSYTLSHRGQDRRASLPRTHVPPRCRPD